MLKKMKPAALICLVSATGAMALDEYLPVPPRVMEINIGLDRAAVPGYFDGAWEYQEEAYENDPFAIPLQGKFGLADKLEGSIAVDYYINDITGETGFDRPVLGLKYAEPALGVGGFLAVTLPVGFEDIVTAEPYASLTFGALYGKALPYISLLANAYYSFNTENDVDSKFDELQLYVKPEYALPIPYLSRKKQYLGVNLGMQYQFFFNHVIEGDSHDDAEHLLTVSPGLYYVFNSIIALDTRAYFAVAGENQPAPMGLSAILRFTLNEELYNSL